MKASLTRGKGFLGVLLYVFDAKNERREDVIREINTLDRSQFPTIGELNGYTRHAISPVADAGKHRYFSENRMRNMSERSLVRASEQSTSADRVLQNIPLDHGYEADGVRRESEYPGEAGPAAPDAGGGRGIDAGAVHRRDAGSEHAADDRLDRSRKLPEIVGGNMGRGDIDPRQLSKDFAAIRKLRRDIEKPVWHCSLALPEGERLSSEKWDEVARDMMREMGFDPDLHQYTVVRHNDTDHDHVHLVANRIGMDGSVWLGRKDVFAAIEATQALERLHGLVLTPGIDSEPPEKRKPTRKEIQMAARTQDEPPRMRLQALVDEAAKGNPTVVEFAKRLEAEGVGVRANLASTGTMNGFSFELAGVSFSGSQLGAGYKWAALQKKGVSYEQARDGEELGRFKKPHVDGLGAADRGPASDPAIEPGRDAGDAERRAGDTGQVPGIDGTAAGDDGRSDGRNNAHLAADGRSEIDAAGRSDRPGEQGRDGNAGPLRERSRDRSGAGEAEPRIERSIGPDANERGGNPEQNGGRQIDDAGRNEGARADDAAGREVADSQQAGMVGKAGADAPVRSNSSDWRARFKQASAAKRRASELRDSGPALEQGQPSRTHVADADRSAARQIDPTAYLEAAGFECKRSRSGTQISVRRNGDEVYRVTEKDGAWVTCDHYGNGVGDNISLVQDVQRGMKFPAAVQQLIGTLTPGLVRSFTPTPRPPLVLPDQRPVDRAQGRAYLQDRGIDLQTIIDAEKAGFVRYADRAVLFVGLGDNGQAKAATRRAATKDDPLQKSDLEGSDKRFPAILKGTSSLAYIVDGGVDALALHSLAKRRGQPTPTVYVTGGVGTKSWLDRAPIQAQLRQHSEIVIAGENEKDDATQERTDVHRAETAQRIEAITRDPVRTVTPPPGQGKDMADVNKAEVLKARAAEEAAARDASAAQAIKDEQARRIAEVQRKKGLNDLVPSVLGYATSHAMKEAGGDPDKVDWQAVEDAATHHLIAKYHQSPESVAKGIIQHSPGRADPATHDQVRQHIAEVAPAMQQDRNTPDIDDQDLDIVR